MLKHIKVTLKGPHSDFRRDALLRDSGEFVFNHGPRIVGYRVEEEDDITLFYDVVERGQNVDELIDELYGTFGCPNPDYNTTKIVELHFQRKEQ